MKKDFSEEREILLEHIERKGLRKTAQRDLILDVFLSTEEHLTSEDLYRLVQMKDATVGHTTVYRTLKLFAEAGLAQEVHFGDGKTYYEQHHADEHHDHIICTACGKVEEFFSAEIESLQDQIAAGLGFRPTHHSLRMWGLCIDCQKTASDDDLAAPGVQPRVRVRSKKTL